MRNKDDIFYQAVLARDYRFDGKFFVGVKTTGIYCRPICPAKPKKENMVFFPDALSAEKSGYRPCLRCRPECAPLSPAWIGKSAVVQRALKLIANNQLLESNEDRFAERLGVSARHLRRLFEEELGKTPKQISDSNRLDFARKLIVETNISITHIAFTSGFSSVRRFNDAIKKRFRRSPSDLRKTQSDVVPDTGIHLTLPYRPPFDWESLIRFYQSHEIGGVETVTENRYERVFKLDGAVGGLRVEPNPEKPELKLRVVTEDYKNLFRVVQKLRQMFDLDSDPILIANSFSESRFMNQLCQKYPGLRIPRGWDPFETAICSILGQFVSTEQAARLIKQLVTNYGEEVKNPLSGLTSRLFPTPKTLVRESLTQLGTTQARKNTIREFTRQVLEGKITLESTQDPSAFKEALRQINGIGPWTAEYVSLRALGDTDAFPHTDLILKRVAHLHADLNLDHIQPWRAYAAIYLWKEYAKLLSSKKEKNNDALL
jgi:AraC family transcriptional regulator of adaptative response / DNA-3-methyladenine glycosylase II